MGAETFFYGIDPVDQSLYIDGVLFAGAGAAFGLAAARKASRHNPIDALRSM